MKTPTKWSQNPSTEAGMKTYSDSAVTYNSSTVTYSSIVIGDQADTEKTPTEWEDA